MKKIVLTFGLISGAIVSGMMLITLPFHDALGFDRSLILGYTSMVLAFLLVFLAATRCFSGKCSTSRVRAPNTRRLSR